jgi:oligoendopeptidase F
MRVDINYYDLESLNSEEVKERLKELGLYSNIRVSPDTDEPEDFIFFGLSELLSKEIFSLILDGDPDLYSNKIQKLKKDTLKQVSDILDKVIMYTEKRIVDG